MNRLAQLWTSNLSRYHLASIDPLLSKSLRNRCEIEIQSESTLARTRNLRHAEVGIYPKLSMLLLFDLAIVSGYLLFTFWNRSDFTSSISTAQVNFISKVIVMELLCCWFLDIPDRKLDAFEKCEFHFRMCKTVTRSPTLRLPPVKAFLQILWNHERLSVFGRTHSNWLGNLCYTIFLQILLAFQTPLNIQKRISNVPRHCHWSFCNIFTFQCGRGGVGRPE